MRTIAFEAELLERGPTKLARAALDSASDIVLRHVDVARLFHRQAEPVITVRIAPTLSGRDRDLPGHLGELLALLGVGEGLLVLDRRPLGMSGHLLPVGSLTQLQ